MTKVISIDPGKTGYICELDTSTTTVRAMKIPIRESDEIVDNDLIFSHFDIEKADMIIMESINPNPAWAHHRAFSFGKTVGQLQGVMSPFKYQEVPARRWQSHMLAGVYGDDPKGRALNMFLRLNPNFPAQRNKINHNMVDAFLIGAYGLKLIGAYRAPGGWKFDHVKPNKR